MENNVRLIDANAMRNDWLENGENECVYDTNAVLDSIDAQPTIDPESLRPVRVSFWESYSTSAFGGYKDGEVVWLPRKFYRCEKCRNGSAIRSNYCPNCGAKMENSR